MDLSNLKNTYFGLRHGESEANVAGLIVAGEQARVEYGLTEKGKKQVADAVTQAKEQGLLNNQTIILASPLKRAYETAVEAANALGVPVENILTEERLRERSFGTFEGQSHDAYKEIIWPADLSEREHEHGVESTQDVKDRLLALVEELEGRYNDKHILFVSHGDTLQIFETSFKDMPSSHHRSLPHLQNAEIRQYN